MDSNCCTPRQYSPKHHHLQLDQELVNSVFDYAVGLHGLLSERNECSWWLRSHDQRNAGKVEPLLTAHDSPSD